MVTYTKGIELMTEWTAQEFTSNRMDKRRIMVTGSGACAMDTGFKHGAI